MSDRLFHPKPFLDQVSILSLLNHYPYPVLVFDLQTRLILYGNPEACRFYGYSAEQFPAMTIGDLRLSPADHFDDHDPYITMVTGVFYDTHTTFMGGQFYMEIRAVFLPVSGRQLGVLFLHDVTYEKMIKDRLRDSEQYYRFLCEQSPIPLLIYDWSAIKRYLDTLNLPDPRLLKDTLTTDPQKLMDCLVQIDLKYINRQVYALFEIPDRETLYKNFLSILTIETRQSFLEILVALYNGKQQLNGRTRLGKPGGEIMDIVYRLNLPDEYQASWSKVIIAIIDVSGLSLMGNPSLTGT